MVEWSQVVSLPYDWPKQKEITPTKESEIEANMIKEVMYIATEKSEEIYQLFGKLFG